MASFIHLCATCEQDPTATRLPCATGRDSPTRPCSYLILGLPTRLPSSAFARVGKGGGNNTHTRTDLENETQISDDLRDAGQGSTVHMSPAYAAH